MHDPQVAFPDDGDTIKDGNEQHALRQDAGNKKIEIRHAASIDHPAMAHDLAENQQPERGLYRARRQLGGVMV